MDKFGGSFVNCIKQCNQSSEKLLKLIVTHFPSFRDEAVIDGQRVSLYKRAQILMGIYFTLEILFLLLFASDVNFADILGFF